MCKTALEDYFYDLPSELIAQTPLRDRSASRLLVIDRNSGKTKHDVFSNIASYFSPGDCLVLNDTKVMPARLHGKKRDTQAAVEVLLLERKEGDAWEVLVKPGRKCRIGALIDFGESLSAKVTDVSEDGARLIEFTYDGIFEEILDRLGEMPLPPYISAKLADRDRYQTVYAKHDGSAAAPTAGLHFTPEMLSEIRDMGVHLAYVTLHVGLGTFRPVKVEDVTKHHMHSEYYEISPEAAQVINDAKEAGGRVVCVGTTSLRLLETVSYPLAPSKGKTDIFIYPGYQFKVADALITNFHLPESTLLMLVSAFAGRENVLNAYREAIEEGYRFYSFGDCCLFR